MRAFAYKFVASLLVVITLLMTNVCPCAMVNATVTQQNVRVMSCCGNEGKTPASDQESTACKQSCSMRVLQTTKPVVLEAPSAHFTLFTFSPILSGMDLAPIAMSNWRGSCETIRHSPSSLLRLHCALLI